MKYLQSVGEIPGSYRLESFEIENLEGNRTPWGQGTHGLLIYSPDGYMSVSINKNVEAPAGNGDSAPSAEAEFEALFDSILFYSGTYQVEGTLVRHQVTQASNPSRIGKEMLRHAEWEGSRLRLTTPPESFGRAILVWKRIGA